MPNTSIPGHPLIGTTHLYHGGEEPYDPASDTDGGVLLIGNGMQAQVESVFKDWNGVAGLDMLYIYVPQTRQHTHVVPADLGLPPLD
jgi:hypothetical protein